MGDGERSAVSTSSIKSGGTPKHHKQGTEEEEVSTLADAQVGKVKAAILELPSVKEKGETEGVFKPTRCPTLVDRDSAPVGCAFRESSVEIESEKSGEDGGKNRPVKVCFVWLRKADTTTFSYSSLLVPLNILFEQINGFTLHPR